MGPCSCVYRSFCSTGELHCFLNHSLEPGEKVRVGKAKRLLPQIGFLEIALSNLKSRHGSYQTLHRGFLIKD